MSRRIILHAAAFRDLDETSAYIGENSPRASVRFLEAAQRAFRRLADMPGLGAPRDYDNPALAGLRMMPIPGFQKYGVLNLPLNFSHYLSMTIKFRVKPQIVQRFEVSSERLNRF